MFLFARRCSGQVGECPQGVLEISQGKWLLTGVYRMHLMNWDGWFSRVIEALESNRLVDLTYKGHQYDSGTCTLLQ